MIHLCTPCLRTFSEECAKREISDIYMSGPSKDRQVFTTYSYQRRTNGGNLFEQVIFTALDERNNTFVSCIHELKEVHRFLEKATATISAGDLEVHCHNRKALINKLNQLNVSSIDLKELRKLSVRKATEIISSVDEHGREMNGSIVEEDSIKRYINVNWAPAGIDPLTEVIVKCNVPINSNRRMDYTLIVPDWDNCIDQIVKTHIQENFLPGQVTQVRPGFISEK